MHSFDDDKELDLFSKEAADAIDAPNTANWEKMHRKLDKEIPQVRKRRDRIIWWILPVLIVTGLAYYTLFYHSKPLESSQENAAQKINTDQKSKRLNTEKNTKSNNELDAPIEQLVMNLQNKKTIKYRPQQIYNESGSNIFGDAALNTVKTNPIPEELTASTKSDCCLASQNTTYANTLPLNSDTASIRLSVSKETDNIKLETTNQNQKNILSLTKNKKNNGFFIGLIGGFDASTVKYKYGSNIGYNIGGTLGYRFNSHWSIQSGAIYTQKNYKLNGQDFHPPKGSWISNYEIELVNGYCRMWDIPLIATYHFSGNNNGNSFLSIGTSSYFMKRENYNYLYAYNNAYYRRSSNYNSTDQHLFALLHISGGIERPIGKNITSIIEPYAKIPLGGVGFGSILLSSFGLNFSVQYRQPKK